jgi:hypothetical protein
MLLVSQTKLVQNWLLVKNHNWKLVSQLDGSSYSFVPLLNVATATQRQRASKIYRIFVLSRKNKNLFSNQTAVNKDPLIPKSHV